MATPINDDTMSTYDIGCTLQRLYPSDNSGSIDHFYLQIRKRFSSKKRCKFQVTNQTIQRILLAHEWKKVTPGKVWPSLFFGYFQKKSGETDREQEDRLNEEIRKKLKAELEMELAKHGVVVHIMLTRACNYCGSEIAEQRSTTPTSIATLSKLPPLTTEEIRELLNHEHYEDKSFDYFYLQIRRENMVLKIQEINKIIEEYLLRLECNCFKLEPAHDWPSIYFVAFNKLPVETDREQEGRLNRDVRMKLKMELEKRIAESYDPKKHTGEKPSVHIMITRVCKYTGPDEDYLESKEWPDDDYLESEAWPDDYFESEARPGDDYLEQS